MDQSTNEEQWQEEDVWLGIHDHLVRGCVEDIDRVLASDDPRLHRETLQAVRDDLWRWFRERVEEERVMQRGKALLRHDGTILATEMMPMTQVEEDQIRCGTNERLAELKEELAEIERDPQPFIDAQISWLKDLIREQEEDLRRCGDNDLTSR